jgi:hypothetical protein
VTVTEQPAGYQLAHPVYLDVAMMISFLAYLEGGVVTHEEATQKEAGTKERILKGRAGLRARLPWAFDAEAGSEGSSQHRDDMSLESKSARQHTAASLFNLLYEYLAEDDQLISLTEPSQLEELRTRQLVELTGEYLGNPLEDILAYVATVYPYVAEQQRAQLEELSEDIEQLRKDQKSGNPAKRAQAQAIEKELGVQDPTETLAALKKQAKENESGLNIMLRMAEEIRRVPVHDLLFRVSSGLQAVVTASSEYYTPEINEYLRAGEFRVIGKVTKIVTGSNTINLTRRTVLGAANPEIAQDIFASLETEDMKLEVPDPIVAAPALQVLPMAIFI